METGKKSTLVAKPSTHLNAIIVLQMNREVADGGTPIIEHKGFDTLLTEHTSAHKRWAVIRQKDQNPRIGMTLEPCIQYLTERECEITIVETDEDLSVDSLLEPIVQQLHTIATHSHVLICTRSLIRERLIATIFGQIYGVTNPPRFTATQAHKHGGSADVLTPQTAAVYTKATAGKRGASEPDPNQRVLVRLIST